MDTPIEEQQEYQHITCNIAASEHEITQANSLSEDFIKYVSSWEFFMVTLLYNNSIIKLISYWMFFYVHVCKP